MNPLEELVSAAKEVIEQTGGYVADTSKATWRRFHNAIASIERSEVGTRWEVEACVYKDSQCWFPWAEEKTLEAAKERLKKSMNFHPKRRIVQITTIRSVVE